MTNTSASVEGKFPGWHAPVTGHVRGAEIRVTGLTHRYRHAKENALQDINLRIASGEAAAIIGRSGCGKSTLLHIIAGLVKPSVGEVTINGLVIRHPSPRWVMMFQQPSLFPWASVADNVALGLRFNGRQSEAKSRVAELLDLVELGSYASRNVQDLSGGQQQRVALARSLALSPEALLLDEPFSALDTFTRSTMQRDVRRIARELGITLVLVTHDINEAALMSDRAFIMAAHPGRIRNEVTVRSADTLTGAPGFEQAQRALIEAYEGAAGRSISSPSTDWTI
ncbi:MAG: ABC transporter ATP-binding protein [Hyphomicrobium sp.]|nr:ABC transporter ATP-binding protein [Hyphomicrobium sp.]